MSSNIYTAGLRNVGSYQVSGQPYLSGAVTSATLGSNQDGYFQFPYVTKKVIVSNESSTRDAIVSFVPFDRTIKTYGFANDASGSGNWLLLQKGTSIELDVKCKEIFVAPASANAVDFISVYAELTNIPTGSMYSFDGLEGIST
tara:strand:+ start:120 stop:551 length:432 start_codon:yes stop_codon:yes gene_type:complete